MKIRLFAQVYDVPYNHQPDLDPPICPRVIFIRTSSLRRVGTRRSEDLVDESFCFARMKKPTWSTSRWMFPL